jgi:hypothetical protein
MAQYTIGIDREKVRGFLVRDDGLKKLIQKVFGCQSKKEQRGRVRENPAFGIGKYFRDLGD